MLTAWLWYAIICLGVLLLKRYHWKRRRLYILANSLKGPPSLPLIGNALNFLCKEEDLFERVNTMVKSYSSPVRIWLGPKLIVAVKSAPEIEKILKSPICNSRDDVYRFFEVFSGRGLFFLNGAAWKKQRKFVTPFLGHKYMESYFKKINKSATLLIQVLEKHVNNPTFDIEHDLKRCCNDIVSEILMGFNPEAQNGKIEDIVNAISRMYILLHARIMKVWLHPNFLFQLSSNGKEQMAGQKMFHEFLNKGINLIDNRKTEIDVLESDRFISIGEHLINTKNSNLEFYSDQNVVDHIATLYNASEDTVTTVSSFLFVVLGMYPHIQDKIVNEIKYVLGDFKKTVDFKDLAELKYLDMCVKEILRFFPIAPYILRKLDKDFQLDNHVLCKDCTVAICIYSVHRDPAYWERPNEFYPEHYLPEAVSSRHPFAFLPFSLGARSCPGQLLAYTAIKTVVATVLQNYVIEADGTIDDIKLKADISIRPVNGHKLRIRKRID